MIMITAAVKSRTMGNKRIRSRLFVYSVKMGKDIVQLDFFLEGSKS